MEIMGLFTVIVSILLIIAPLAIWFECRQIRKMLQEQSATKSLWQECYNIRNRLDRLIKLFEGQSGMEEPR